MLEEMITEEVKDLFLEDLFKDNFTYPNHRFSLRYKYRKKRILKQLSQKNHNMNSETAAFQPTHKRIPLKYALLIVILLLFAILGFTVYRNYSGLFVREHDKFSLMFADYNQNTPVVLTEKFYIDMDLSDYEQVVIFDNDLGRRVRYIQNGETQVVVEQTIISGTNVRLNTENALIMPQSISINTWSGIYYQSYDGCHIFIFNLSDYIISYLGFLNKEDIEELLKSTKFN